MFLISLISFVGGLNCRGLIRAGGAYTKCKKMFSEKMVQNYLNCENYIIFDNTLNNNYLYNYYVKSVHSKTDTIA